MEIIDIASNLNKEFFKYEHISDIRINDNFFCDEDNIKEEESAILEAPFTLEE